MKSNNYEAYLMETAQALADSDLNVVKAAKKFYVHRNTMVYRIAVIKEKTGKNLLCFYDLCDVLGYKKEGENVSSDSDGQSV